MIRDILPSDAPVIEHIHQEMGIDYKFPDLTNPLVLIKKIAVNDEGKVIGATICRLEAEVYLWLDTETPIEDKVEVMKELNSSITQEAWVKGLDTLTCKLPPGMEEKFQRRLKLMGWEADRPGWVGWGRRLGP